MRKIESEKITEYVEKVYAYAVKRTYSREEAEELSQEILFTVVKELTKLKEDSRFEPWLWGVAENVTRSFRRKQARQRATYTYDFPESWFEQPVETQEEAEGAEEFYGMLRGRIAMLSAMYRDIIILHYYDGLSIKEISERLGLPEGTVTWRLSEGRKKLKKECVDMEESALRPVKMRIDIYGSGNYGTLEQSPAARISDALSQNILYHCYEQVKGVEELAKTCGVPAYYVEERIAHLLKKQAVIEQVKGKYRTNFIIWSDKHGIYCEEYAEKALQPIHAKMMESLHHIAEEVKKINFYRAEKSEEELFYLYGVMAFDYIRANYYNNPFPEIPEKYDGFCWNYTGNVETGAHPHIGLGVSECSNNDGRYAHTVYSCFGGFSYRQMMYDNYIDACEWLLLGEEERIAEVHAMNGGRSECGTVAQAVDDKNSKFSRRAATRKNDIALAIRDGYIIRREDGSYFVTAPAFTLQQKKKFDEIVHKYMEPLMEEYTVCVENFLKGYKKLFPKHLQLDADYMCSHMFFSMYCVIIDVAQRAGELSKPAKGSICDVLVQYRE